MVSQNHYDEIIIKNKIEQILKNLKTRGYEWKIVGKRKENSRKEINSNNQIYKFKSEKIKSQDYFDIALKDYKNTSNNELNLDKLNLEVKENVDIHEEFSPKNSTDASSISDSKQRDDEKRVVNIISFSVESLRYIIFNFVMKFLWIRLYHLLIQLTIIIICLRKILIKINFFRI